MQVSSTPCESGTSCAWDPRRKEGKLHRAVKSELSAEGLACFTSLDLCFLICGMD